MVTRQETNNAPTKGMEKFFKENRLCKCFMCKEKYSAYLLGLKDTHNVFWWETLNKNNNFVYKKTPHGAFNIVIVSMVLYC